MYRVVLTIAEMSMAAQVGINRNLVALRNRLRDANGFTGEGWNIHIEGACGECAVAKFLNVHWSGSVNTFKRGGDVQEYQVRTRSRHDYDLNIRPDDDPAQTFILVTGIAPEFHVRGWIQGAEARRDEFWKDYGDRNKPAWFVPAQFLHDMTTVMSKAA